MNAHDLPAFKKHVRTYIGVFIALLVGTLLTVAVSYVHFGHAGNITVALIIAVVKAALVAGFFMHLVSEKRSIYTVLGFTAFFFLGLMFLTVWSMQDHPDLTVPLVNSAPATLPAHHVP
jgi:cytochrome c oxidase subunit IV